MEVETSTIATLVALGSLTVAILNFIWARFKEGTKLRERISSLEQSRTDNEKSRASLKNLEDRESTNSDRLTRLETKMELFWTAMTDNAIKALHHPTETRADLLLLKFKEKTITLAEMEELKQLIRCRLDSKLAKKKNGESYWATFMLARIDMALVDAGAIKITTV